MLSFGGLARRRGRPTASSVQRGLATRRIGVKQLGSGQDGAGDGVGGVLVERKWMKRHFLPINPFLHIEPFLWQKKNHNLVLDDV